MKLKKLISLDFMQEFQSLLETEFEKQLFLASLRNYASHGNPLRFHNFAFSMRELVLHVIQRKAPISEVKRASWYRRESDKYEVTRRQQLKYCAQENISDAYLGDVLLEELDECISVFLSEFNFFNKYTHITEKYFNVSPKSFFRDARNVVEIAKDSLEQLRDLERIVIAAVEEKVEDAVVSTALSTIPESLSLLAEYVFVEYTEVNSIDCIGITEKYIFIEALGNVHVTQEYGPIDDRCRMNLCYPFALQMKSSVENPEDFTVLSNELDIDTSAWYA